MVATYRIFWEPPTPIVLSVPVVLVFLMSLCLRSAKKLRSITTFGGSSTATDVMTGLFGLRLFARYYYRYASCVSLLPGSRRPGPLIPLRSLSLRYFVMLGTHLHDGLQSIHCYRAHAIKSTKKGSPSTALQILVCSPLCLKEKSPQSSSSRQPACIRQSLIVTEYVLYLLRFRSCFFVHYFRNVRHLGVHSSLQFVVFRTALQHHRHQTGIAAYSGLIQ